MAIIEKDEQHNINSLWNLENVFFRDFDNVSLPLGGLTLQDCEELYLLIKEHFHNASLTKLNIVEVGSWTGHSTLLLNLLVKKYGGQLWAVDWFKGSPGTNLEFAGNFFNIRKIFDENLKKFGEEKSIKVIEALSEDAVKEFEDNSLDVVFLDANHCYDGIKEDIELWLPKIKSGGLMCGHDCELIFTDGINTILEAYRNIDMIKTLHFGVCKAVTELGGKKVRSCPPFTPEESMESKIWYYTKP